MSLSFGARGEQVRELQLLLAMTGLADAGVPDAIFGQLTRAAVRRARGALRLIADDQADDELLARLRELPRRHVPILKVRTPATVEELCGALARGYEKVFGRGANPLAIRVALAQLQEEHGVEDPAIWIFNLGNQDAVAPWQGPFFWLTAPEELGGEREEKRKALRAFATLEEGVEGYWRRLLEGYAGALWAFERGAPGRAAELLKALSYFTGELEGYRRAMIDRFAALGQLGLG